MEADMKKVPEGSWLAWVRDNPDQQKPSLSTGTPEELTPNQLAEQEASAAARRTLEEEEGGLGLQREAGWRALSRNVGGCQKKPDGMSPLMLRRWSEGFKVGFEDLDVDCPELAADERDFWMKGVADGTKALMRMERENPRRKGFREKDTIAA